jgi:signal transduction histidine kinase/HPt (histidine-containing phosphotransfer) domain-containing protein
LLPGTPLEYADGRYRLGVHRWPVDASGQIAFKLPAREAIATTSFQRVAAAALGITDDPLLGERFAGRVVFVGSSVFASEQPLVQRDPRPDTRLLAGATSALAADEVLSLPSRALDGLLILIALLPAVALWRRARPDAPVDALLALAAMAAIWMIGTLALAAARVQSHTLIALTVTAVAWALALWQYVGYMQRANRRLASERTSNDAASRAKSEFVARVSHEIRQPMHSLLGMAEQLAGTPLDAEQRRRVMGLRASGQTLLKLIDDLADLSKIGAGRLELNPALFSLPDLLADVSALMQPQVAQQGLAWTVQVDPGLNPGTWCDPRRLQQVLLNLAGNALKFTTQGGITISVRRDPQQPEMLQFAVADTGIGIAASKHQSIFEPYVQADGVVTLNQGATGLGLSITKRLVEMMGGDIRIESAPGLGATFLFTVLAPPRALQEALVPRGEVAAARAASEPLAPTPMPPRATAPPPARPAMSTLTHLDSSGVVDATAACDRLGNDVSLYRRRLAHAQVFLADWPIFFRASRQLGQPDQAARLADDLTGIAATIGAQPLSDAARDLERAMRAGAASTEIERLVDPVLERLQAVVQALSQAFEAENTATNGSPAWPARQR